MTDPQKTIAPNENWLLPGGSTGLQGTPEGVRRALETHPLPEHDRAALLEKIADELQGTDFNFIQIFGNQVRHDSETGRETIVSLHLKTSKKSL